MASSYQCIMINGSSSWIIHFVINGAVSSTRRLRFLLQCLTHLALWHHDLVEESAHGAVLELKDDLFLSMHNDKRKQLFLNHIFLSQMTPFLEPNDLDLSLSMSDIYCISILQLSGGRIRGSWPLDAMLKLRHKFLP